MVTKKETKTQSKARKTYLNKVMQRQPTFLQNRVLAVQQSMHTVNRLVKNITPQKTMEFSHMLNGPIESSTKHVSSGELNIYEAWFFETPFSIILVS